MEENRCSSCGGLLEATYKEAVEAGVLVKAFKCEPCHTVFFTHAKPLDYIQFSFNLRVDFTGEEEEEVRERRQGRGSDRCKT